MGRSPIFYHTVIISYAEKILLNATIPRYSRNLYTEICWWHQITILMFTTNAAKGCDIAYFKAKYFMHWAIDKPWIYPTFSTRWCCPNFCKISTLKKPRRSNLTKNHIANLRLRHKSPSGKHNFPVPSCGCRPQSDGKSSSRPVATGAGVPPSNLPPGNCPGGGCWNRLL